MGIKLLTTVEDGLGTVGKSIVADTQEDYILVQEIFQRAGNLWPDASPQVKRIIDLVTNGKVMQDYGPDVNADDLFSKRKSK